MDVERRITCKHGHELSGDNLYVKDNERGVEFVCKTCRREWGKRYKAARAIRLGLKHQPNHGHAKKNQNSRTYRCWIGIKVRCYNPKEQSYKYYGARGITMCDKWKVSYETFLSDMGECPRGMTIERDNTNGNYEP